MYSLWEQAKSLVSYRFQDVWFVIGREGTIAQINDTVQKAKARILIVAPEIEDIDPVPLLGLKPHVAVRIAANIDPNSSKGQEVMRQLAQRPNVEIRSYPKKNVWGISRESEETLLSAVSGLGDVAGIATVVDEHQKMFLPILEDCWLQGKMYILPTVAAPAVISKKEEVSVQVTERRPAIAQDVLNAIFKPFKAIFDNISNIVETIQQRDP